MGAAFGLSFAFADGVNANAVTAKNAVAPSRAVRRQETP